MDSPIVTQLFRQLFRHQHPACQSRRRNLAHIATTYALRDARRRKPHTRGADARRLYSTPRRGPAVTPANESDWQQRTAMFTQDMSEEFNKFPVVTAKDLRGRKERPRRLKMLMRDFIEDSLYNPHYGYFSKQVVIFTPGKPFDFPLLRDDFEFQSLLSKRYTEFEDGLDAVEPSDTRQLWYTPTELFRPYYGEAVARYLVANYKLTSFPYHDLIIYEMGAGRGTLMLNILDYIRDIDPDVYHRTQYKIVEISSQLADLQRGQLTRPGGGPAVSAAGAAAASRGHADRVEIINRSIFDWDQPVPSPCFFLAFEVFDNFAHDVLRYDLMADGAAPQPLQGMVLIDEAGDFYEFYTPHTDPVARRFLRMREAATNGQYKVPFPSTRLGRWAATSRPFAPNLSGPEYIPTRLMQFFDVLARYFPAHRLVTSDFHALPNAIRGLNAPIVQTRFERRPVPVTTPLVHQGYFDIMFPTDFDISEKVYQAITGKLTRVMPHESFMRRWADLEETETRSGENPLLSWYRNASVLLTV